MTDIIERERERFLSVFFNQIITMIFLRKYDVYKMIRKTKFRENKGWNPHKKNKKMENRDNRKNLKKC